jgi:glycosyltransferase involved in cell wall biosynthesis
MLSILIPIYNFDCHQLVVELTRQCEEAGIEWEIICFDDGSTELYKQLNRVFSNQTNLTYRELPKNLGRSAIRNALAEAARHPYLLFMDCDSKVVRENFIRLYLNHLDPGVLVYGGRCYSPTPPAGQSLFFHWHYGIHREQNSPKQRQKAPYQSFMTNNFLIPKAIFLNIRFDESLKQYGHEDTLFGMELAKRKIPIVHIDNPLEHSGLEPFDVFLEKTKLGIENLHLLWKRGTPVDTKLLRAYKSLDRMASNYPFFWCWRAVKPLVLKQLSSKFPLLPLFDFYKLGLFLSKNITHER